MGPVNDKERTGPNGRGLRLPTSGPDFVRPTTRPVEAPKDAGVLKGVTGKENGP